MTIEKVTKKRKKRNPIYLIEWILSCRTNRVRCSVSGDLASCPPRVVYRMSAIVSVSQVKRTSYVASVKAALTPPTRWRAAQKEWRFK